LPADSLQACAGSVYRAAEPFHQETEPSGQTTMRRTGALPPDFSGA
jgi:hypothetical protein